MLEHRQSWTRRLAPRIQGGEAQAVVGPLCNLTDRLDKNLPSINTCLLMELMLLSGQADDINVCQTYPELNQHSLRVPLHMFQSIFRIDYFLFEAQMAFQTMVPKVRE